MEALNLTWDQGLTASPAGLADSCLEEVIARQTVVRRTLQNYEHTSLRDYVQRAPGIAAQSYQPRDDLYDVVHRYTARLLGEDIADTAVAELKSAPMALTANHHGVDFFAQSVQSSLAFALRATGTGEPARTIPVFACGAVPLNNLTYPRGLLLYRGDAGQAVDLPARLPMFPDRLKTKLVSTVPGVSREMVDRGLARARRMMAEGCVSQDLDEALRTILEQDYAAEAVLGCADYSDQAVILNHRIFKRLFSDRNSAPDLVYLEVERISAALLELDLADPTSLVSQLWFSAPVLEALVSELDGERACWDRSVLEAPMESGKASAGTVFFWALDPAGRRIPLTLDMSSDQILLKGFYKDGTPFQTPFTAQAMVEALQNRTLTPSLFTSYLVIALARGITCIGGYYQAEYLPVMQRAVVNALVRDSSLATLDNRVGAVPTDCYLSGMQAVMTLNGPGRLSPAGVVEIIAGGGLGTEDLDRMAELDIHDAHLASVTDTVFDVAPDLIDAPGWQNRIGAELFDRLRRKVVVR